MISLSLYSSRATAVLRKFSQHSILHWYYCHKTAVSKWRVVSSFTNKGKITSFLWQRQQDSAFVTQKNLPLRALLTGTHLSKLLASLQHLKGTVLDVHDTLVVDLEELLCLSPICYHLHVLKFLRQKLKLGGDLWIGIVPYQNWIKWFNGYHLRAEIVFQLGWDLQIEALSYILKLDRMVQWILFWIWDSTPAGMRLADRGTIIYIKTGSNGSMDTILNLR